MKAIVVERPGGPEVLELQDVPDPRPATGEVLVRVRAAGVNRADLLQRMGRYPPPAGASPLLGLELAGEILGTGTRFASGDRVMALVAGGGYASLAAVPETVMLPVPPGMTWPQAAAIPEAFLTAWHNLVDLGGVATGEAVLIHAGASGVGSAAIQLARELGADVLAVVGSQEKEALCRELGARVVLDRRGGNLAARVLDATAERGVDLVLDVVGAPMWDENLKALRHGGRLVLIGFLGGSRGELDLGPVLRKSLHVTGTTLRGKSPEAKERLVREFGEFALPRFQDKRLRPVVDRVFPLAEARAAHAYMGGNKNSGKIVLEIE